MDSGMNYAIQKAAVKALQVSDEWYTNLTEVYSERREIIYQICEKLNVVYDPKAVGMFVWAKLPEGTNDKDFIDEILYNKKVFITPGSIFGRICF